MHILGISQGAALVLPVVPSAEHTLAAITQTACFAVEVCVTAGYLLFRVLCLFLKVTLFPSSHFTLLRRVAFAGLRRVTFTRIHLDAFSLRCLTFTRIRISR